MASSTKRDQVLLGILAGVTTESFVVDLEIGHRAAGLAPPAISSQHFIAKLLVRLGVQS